LNTAVKTTVVSRGMAKAYFARPMYLALAQAAVERGWVEHGHEAPVAP
jgi:hypothetical protein